MICAELTLLLLRIVYKADSLIIICLFVKGILIDLVQNTQMSDLCQKDQQYAKQDKKYAKQDATSTIHSLQSTNKGK